MRKVLAALLVLFFAAAVYADGRVIVSKQYQKRQVINAILLLQSRAQLTDPTGPELVAELADLSSTVSYVNAAMGDVLLPDTVCVDFDAASVRATAICNALTPASTVSGLQQPDQTVSRWTGTCADETWFIIRCNP